MIHQFMLTCLTLSLLFVPLSAPAQKSYTAERFDIDVAVQHDGTLHVTENLTLRFTGGPFTYVFRELPTDLTDGIDTIQASVDGVALPQGSNAGQVEVEGKNPIKITWHFAPTSDSVHTFKLSYRVRGVMQSQNDADVLRWQALPDIHDYSIAHSTVRVTYPENVKLLGAPTLQTGEAAMEYDSTSATFTAHDLAPDSTLIVALRFEPGGLAIAAPQWQVRQSKTEAYKIPALGGSILLFVVGSLWILLYRQKYQRPIPEPILETTRPPDELPPAIAGVLANHGSFQATWSYALGAMFDLAQRDVIRIEEMERASRFSSRDFIVKLQSSPTNLRPHEQGLIETLFRTKSGSTSTVRLSKIQNNIYQRLKYFSKTLESDVKAMGVFDKTYQRGRNTLLIGGVILMVLSVIVAISVAALNIATGVWPLSIALSLLLLGGVAMIAGAGISPLSEDAYPVAQAWKHFVKYLQAVMRKREVVAHVNIALSYLPYAAAFGLAASWAQYLKKQESLDIPPWFRALVQGQDGSHAAFIAMIASANSAGGSASAGGAAAGAGAAGGGASGAG